jgi:hypothetical protein
MMWEQYPHYMAGTVLLQTFLAALAFSTGIHKTADAGQLVPCLMDVRVADSTVQDFDEHIVGTRVASLKGEGFERSGRAPGYVSACR